MAPLSSPHPLFLTAALLSAHLGGADPLACKLNALQPMLPIFHIIGNVSASGPGNANITVEAINDASGFTYSANGITHLWHQCWHVPQTRPNPPTNFSATHPLTLSPNQPRRHARLRRAPLPSPRGTARTTGTT